MCVGGYPKPGRHHLVRVGRLGEGRGRGRRAPCHIPPAHVMSVRSVVIVVCTLTRVAGNYLLWMWVWKNLPALRCARDTKQCDATMRYVYGMTCRQCPSLPVKYYAWLFAIALFFYLYFFSLFSQPKTLMTHHPMHLRLRFRARPALSLWSERVLTRS